MSLARVIPIKIRDHFSRFDLVSREQNMKINDVQTRIDSDQQKIEIDRRFLLKINQIEGYGSL